MSSYNVRSPEWYRAVYTDASASGFVATGTSGADNAIVVLSTKHTIFIQKLLVVITGALNANAILFQDDNSTAKVAYQVEASAALGVIRVIDFGARGFALTEGKNFDISGTAGPVYSWAVDAYQKQTTPGQATTIDRKI